MKFLITSQCQQNKNKINDYIILMIINLVKFINLIMIIYGLLTNFFVNLLVLTVVNLNNQPVHMTYYSQTTNQPLNALEIKNIN